MVSSGCSRELCLRQTMTPQSEDGKLSRAPCWRPMACCSWPGPVPSGVWPTDIVSLIFFFFYSLVVVFILRILRFLLVSFPQGTVRCPCLAYGATRPGVHSSPMYDPRSPQLLAFCARYQSAVTQKEKLVLTPPYMDAFGNGVVLTLCKTLVESRLVRVDATHSALSLCLLHNSYT